MRLSFKLASPFAPDSMWGKWLHLNRQMVACLVCASVWAFLVAFGQGYAYYKYGKLTSWWQWLSVLVLVSGIFWYIIRRKSLAIYEAFLQEVEKRQAEQKQVTLTNIKQSVIRQHEVATSWHWWKMMSVAILGVWGVAYSHQEFKRMNLKEPVRLSIQIKKNITQKQNRLAKLIHDYCEMWTTLRHHQARVVALKRTMTHTQQSVYEQWGNYQQGQGARFVLTQAQNQTPQQIRENNSVLQMIKGQMEIYLFLQNKEAQGAEAMIAQDDRLISGFQDVQNRYDQHLHSAQKSVYRDQNRLTDFQKDLKHEQEIVERLITAIEENKKIRKELEISIHKDCVYWLARLKHEAKKDALYKKN